MLQLCAVGDIMKINIKTTLNNVNTNEKNSIETKGILSGDTIVYYDQNIMMSLDLKERTLKRRSKEYEIILDFQKICEDSTEESYISLPHFLLLLIL